MMDSIQNQRAEALYQEAKESFSALATKLTGERLYHRIISRV